ncbi:MAG: thiamine diphosphokinase [Deltaproteobacteria bacterium]|nr:thiamine diphosphokinase [Deltaproteobacteria bacterium]MBW2052769.1 thiamine diphosphokinase [Deltaproteobacteria bacterium]MBW2142092.1 thiamine diphosphokinase [Deltaproteobacteria bacterium]MBW2324188.1 thiamine diphosphokinase [Deltaproteobacteria bacterium]
MRVVIFANGELNYPQNAIDIITPDDLLIAADGGARHCLDLGVVPDFVVGDLDSLQPFEIKALKKSGAEVVVYARKKNFTDLELAFSLAMDRGANEIIVLGGFGGRWDMTVSNLLLATGRKFSGVSIRLIDGPQEATLIKDGEQRTFQGSRGDVLSLIPLGRDVTGVTLSGLEYALSDQTIKAGSTLGISNVLAEDKATVTIEKGVLLCIISHQK